MNVFYEKSAVAVVPGQIGQGIFGCQPDRNTIIVVARAMVGFRTHFVGVAVPISLKLESSINKFGIGKPLDSTSRLNTHALGSKKPLKRFTEAGCRCWLQRRVDSDIVLDHFSIHL